MGFQPQLILSIDIDTVQSAVAVYYAGGELEEPVVTHVARWPAQEHLIHENKVPSVLLYDADGNLLACGAEAASRDKEMEAEENGWCCVEHFKMHLQPVEILKTNNLRLKVWDGVEWEPIVVRFVLRLNGNICQFATREIPERKLPYVVDVEMGSWTKLSTPKPREELEGGAAQLSDGASARYKAPKAHASQPGSGCPNYVGVDPWIELGRRAQVVLTHPNRWGAEQQKFLQRVAVAAGLIAQSGLSRLAFVEEGEASATYCLSTNPTLAGRLPVDAKFVICDAGGSTTDISAYKVKRTENGIIYVKELEAPRCLDAGGVRVDANFTEFLESRLRQANEDADDDIPRIVSDGLRDLRRTGKRRFRSSATTLQVQIGPRSMRSAALPISKGVLFLKGTDAEALFLPSVQSIIDAIRDITKRDSHMAIILTGAFGESPYLRGELERNFGPDRLILSNSANSKAVAIGGLRLIFGVRGTVLVERSRHSPLSIMISFWMSSFMMSSEVLAKALRNASRLINLPGKPRSLDEWVSFLALMRELDASGAAKFSADLDARFSSNPAASASDDAQASTTFSASQGSLRDWLLKASSDPHLRKRVLYLRRKKAALFGDFVHECLSRLRDSESGRDSMLKLLQDICSSSGELPASYWLAGVDVEWRKPFGRGGEAVIYLGTYAKQPVVVRTALLPAVTDQSIAKMIHREIVTHAQLHHKNIIPLLGTFRATDDSFPAMVLPFMEKGAADRYLQSVPAEKIVGATETVISGITTALAYLHCRKPPVLHGDLHPGNVLISSAGEAVLCDFGFSRIRHEISRVLTIHQGGGHPHYRAPEVSEQIRITEATDMYSSAMTLFALASLTEPFSGFVGQGPVMQAAGQGIRPSRPAKLNLSARVTDGMWALVESMWDQDPLRRPTASVVEREVCQLLGSPM